MVGGARHQVSKAFAQQKQKTDVAQVFLVFMATIGDVEKTAAALDLDPHFVGWLAEQEGWLDKVRRVSIMSKGEKPGDWERAQNRALNFVQAHRARMLMDRLILALTKQEEDEFLEHFRTQAKDGRQGFSARFFSDLMAALDKAHHLSYAALGDSVGERLEREKDEGEASANQIHAALLAALNNPGVQQLGSEALVAEASAAVSAERKALPERTPPAGDVPVVGQEVCQVDSQSLCQDGAPQAP
jgi:hypothetical protein